MGIIVGMGSANERRRYIVTPPLIGWAHTRMISFQGGFINPCAWLHWVTDKLCRQVVGLQGGMGVGTVEWLHVATTHWSWNKMAVILQTTFSNIFSCVFWFGYYLEISYSKYLFPSWSRQWPKYAIPVIISPPLVHTAAIIQWYIHDFTNRKEGLTHWPLGDADIILNW